MAASCPSWATDIYPLLESTGHGSCSTTAHSCHSGGANKPAIADGDPVDTYTTLINDTEVGKRYIAPCKGSDPTESGILCNLDPSIGCGSAMPLTPVAPLPSEDLATIKAWIVCGAPMN